MVDRRALHRAFGSSSRCCDSAARSLHDPRRPALIAAPHRSRNLQLENGRNNSDCFALMGLSQGWARRCAAFYSHAVNPGASDRPDDIAPTQISTKRLYWAYRKTWGVPPAPTLPRAGERKSARA